MKLILRGQSHNSWGGSPLKGHAQHFERYLTNVLKAQGFQSSFESFELTLCEAPPRQSMTDTYPDFFASLPRVRIQSKKKTFDIALPSPLTGLEQALQQAHTVIDAFIQAAQLVQGKIKRSDIFDVTHLTHILLSLKDTLTAESLADIHARQTASAEDSSLQNAMERRQTRQILNASDTRPADKKMRDLRWYDSGFPDRFFQPYVSRYLEIFKNLLMYDGLQCPGYTHLYIQVAETENEALRRTIQAEDWFRYGIAVIDKDAYQHASEDARADMVFDALCSGLRDIARIDSLNILLIEKVIAQVAQQGMDTELILHEQENADYKLIITYTTTPLPQGSPVFLSLTNTHTHKTAYKQIGSIDYWHAKDWIHTVRLGAKQISIKSSTSSYLGASLQGKPTQQTFVIKDFLPS